MSWFALILPIFKDYIRVSVPIVLSGMLWGVAHGGADRQCSDI